MTLKYGRMMLALASLATSTACTINFELTSQRTALENQVMGAYRELEDDLVLVSSVRGGKEQKAALPAGKRRALDARQNQEFNRDDVEELKEKQVLGETAGGALVMLPDSVGSRSGVEKADLRLAQALVDEENGDRATIWQRIIASNENLSAKDLPKVRQTYARMLRDQAAAGSWYQDDDGRWVQKAKN